MNCKLISGLILLNACACPGQVSVWTHHYDNARTGAQLNETQLNTGNVNPASFGKLFTLPVDGSVYAQPLYLPGVSIPASGVHNMLYVATMNDGVYGFDADSHSGANASPIWFVNFTNPAAGITPVPSEDVQPYDANISGPIGIISTPVIDQSTGTLFVLARTKENGAYVQTLHALDIATGAEKFGGPTIVRGSVSATSPDAVNGVLTFDPKVHNQRPSLALANGNVYLAWSSHNDAAAYHGWVMAYSASTLQQTGIWNVTPGNAAGGIWQGGQPPSIDAAGNVYYTAGNGTWDGVRNFSETVLRLSPGLQLTDWFTPDNYDMLNAFDYDLGSCGLLLIPRTNLILATGKQGILYLLNTANMGHIAPGNTQIVQSFLATFGHIHGAPIYWESPARGALVYMWSEFDYLRAFHFNGTTLDPVPAMQSSFTAPDGMPGGMMSVSSNGSVPGTGILWTSTPLAKGAEEHVVSGIVRAFDASDLSRVLWSSELNSARDSIGNFAKFVPPVVTNGKLYMATFSNEVAVYGLLPVTPDFALSAAPAAQTAVAGYTVAYSVSTGPTNGTVALSIAGLPAGVAATFTPSTITGTGSSTLSVSTASATLPGTYTPTVTATGAYTHSFNLTLNVTNQGGPSGPATDLDIGQPALPGSATVNAQTYTVAGAGNDIWTAADQFNFNYWKLSGDGVITARIRSLTNTSFYAKAGVMFRETLDSGSAYAFASGLPSLAAFQYRTGDGTDAAGSPYYPATYPLWVRLVRANGNFTAYSSADGATWTSMGSPVSIGMSASMYAGLAVTSNNSTALNSAVFDNVTITGPDAASGTPDFNLRASFPVLSTVPGGITSAYISSSPQNGFNGQVGLSVTGLPSAATATFSPATLGGSGTSTLTVTASSATASGIYALNVSGTSGNLTRIVPLTLNIGTPPDFAVTATPPSQSVTSGQSAAFTIGETPINGFKPIVTLSVAGLPAGATAIFQPTAIDRLVTSSLTIATTPATPAGTYNVSVTGLSGSLSHNATVTLTVTALPDFSLSAVPVSQSVSAGFGTTYAIATTALNGAIGTATLAVSGLPAGTTAWFNPSLVPFGASSLLNVSTSNATAPGTYNLALTGTGGAIAHSIPLTLTVSAPSDGSNLDIGTPGVPGSSSLSAGVWTVKGAGSDIWGTTDQFHFDSWTLPGDGAITARLVSVTNTGFYAKAGVMIRQSLAANSAYAFAAALPTLSVFQYRAAAALSASGSGYYGVTYPFWLRVARANGNLTGYVSPDGIAWQQMGNTVSVPLSGAVYAGLAVTSQDNTKLNTAVFDNVSITGPDATSGVPDFLIGASPLAQSVTVGGSVLSTAQITAQNGFTDVVNLSMSGLPAGATAIFSPASITGGGTATLTITAASATAPGTYSLDLTGASGTKTRIVPLTLAVSAAQATFTLSASPASQSTAAGGTVPYTVTVTPQNGFTDTVSLSVTGLPGGATASFSSSVLTVNTTPSTAAGTYPLTITGVSGALTKTTTVTLVVTAPAQPDFTLSTAPSAQTVSAGFGTTYAVTTAALNGATGTVTLSVSGLPAGASASFNPTQVPLGSAAQLTINTSSATSAGTYNLTIAATTGSLTHTAPLALTVTAPADGANLDLGTPGLAGSGNLIAGTWTVKGSGSDIWGTSDQFHFDYWPLAGDGAITARLLSVTNTSFYAKAGLMIRQSLTANSPYAFAAALPTLTVFQYRTNAGASASGSGYYNATYPLWLRIVRASGNLTAYASPDGLAWQQMGSTVSVPFTGAVYAGLAVASQDNTKLNTVLFDNLSITGPDPTSGVADFVIGATPLTRTLAVGGNTQTTTQVTAQNGFTGIVDLSITGLPSGVTALFSPASLTGGGAATLTLTAAAGTSPGTYSLNVVGTSGTKSRIFPITLTASVQSTFSLTASPASQSAAAGGSVPYTATVTPQSGFTDPVSLTVTGLPTGATATFSPAIVTGAGTSNLTVNTAASAAAGSYSLAITATGGSITKTSTVTLLITAPAQPDFTLSTSPSSQTASAGFGTTYSIGTGALNGATGSVSLSLSGLPAGASGWFNPASVTLGSASQLTVNTSSATPAGIYNLTVTATSGALTHTAPLTLTVTVPVDGTNLDFGTSGLTGSGTLSAGTWTIKRSGADVWGASDQFHFDYWTLPGDGVITARLLSVTNTNFYAKAGLMMRQSLTANSPYAFATALPTLSVFQYRTGAGASASGSGYYNATYPLWLRVVRANGNVTSYASPDGFAWQQMGNTVSVALTGAVYAGLAVTSHDNTKLNTAVFDNLSITGPDATSGIADFLVSVTPLAKTLTAGGSVQYQTQVIAQNGFTDLVNLTASGLPANATAVLSPNTLTVTAAAGTAPGTYSLNVVGTSGTKIRIAPVTLTIR